MFRVFWHLALLRSRRVPEEADRQVIKVLRYTQADEVSCCNKHRKHAIHRRGEGAERYVRSSKL